MSSKSRLEKMRDQAAKALSAAPPADRFARAQALVARQPNGFAEKSPEQHVAEYTVPEQEVASVSNVRSISNTPSVRTSDGAPYYSEVPLEQIEENPFNARRIYRPERVHEMAGNLRANGQMVPGIATIRNGCTVLAGGHYRFRGLKVAGIPTMKLMIHPGITDQQLYQLSYMENAEREAQSPLDNAIAWKSLIEGGVYANESAIAEVTGMSLPNVNKTLAILKLSEAVLETIKERPDAFALSTLYQLTLLEKAAGPVVTAAMALKVRDEVAVCKDVELARAKYEAKTNRKPKETSRQHRLIGSDGVPLGVLKDWDSGKVSFEINLPDPVQRQALVEELKARFAPKGALPEPAEGAGGTSVMIREAFRARGLATAV
jgi:ParB family chromosome partitioning protein